ncbi:unnamed protein product [Rotaria sordida]|nr:unnamed protein product [Rotaria sordida]
MLNCCNQLNNWTIMSKHIFIGNTTFYRLWSNAYQLNYLIPYVIRTKLKLLISGTEQEQLEQNDLCAKYYIQYPKEQFLLRWSTLSRLSEYARKTTI